MHGMWCLISRGAPAEGICHGYSVPATGVLPATLQKNDWNICELSVNWYYLGWPQSPHHTFQAGKVCLGKKQPLCLQPFHITHHCFCCLLLGAEPWSHWQRAQVADFLKKNENPITVLLMCWATSGLLGAVAAQRWVPSRSHRGSPHVLRHSWSRILVPGMLARALHGLPTWQPCGGKEGERWSERACGRFVSEAAFSKQPKDGPESSALLKHSSSLYPGKEPCHCAWRDTTFLHFLGKGPASSVNAGTARLVLD